VKRPTSGLLLLYWVIVLLPVAPGASAAKEKKHTAKDSKERMFFAGASYVSGSPQFRVHKQLFNLRDDAHAQEAVGQLDGLIALSDQQQAELAGLRKAHPDDLWLKNHEPDILLGRPTVTKADQFALKKARDRIAYALAQTNPVLRAEALACAIEIGNAVNNLSKPAAPPYIDLLTLPVSGPYYYHEYLTNTVRTGKEPAANIPQENDLGRTNPTVSSFWRDENIRAKNTYYGFARSTFPAVVSHDYLLTYKEPKTSSGAEPGFKAKLGDQEVKLKFKETHSAAIAARLYDAVGFNVEVEDYRPGAKIVYDRLIFRQFNMNQPIYIKFGILGLPLLKKNIHRHNDPFLFIGAKLKNGQFLWGDTFKTFLLKDASKPQPELIPDNFKPAAETQIAYLQTTPVNVQVPDDSFKSMGTFEYGALGHDRLREFRGSAIMAAWVTNYDVRRDNTKLKLVSHGPKGPELQYEVPDVGGTFIARVTIGNHFESWDGFPWVFTTSSAKNGKPFRPGSFKVSKTFKVANPTKAFTSLTEDDARWMARKIGALSEDQIKAAAIGGGLDSATATLLTEKLVSRRDQLMRDLGLEQEVGLLRPHGVNTSAARDPLAVNINLNYDPKKDGVAQARLPDGTIVRAPVTNAKIVNGHLLP
jgi:hypothetical protein